MPRLSVVTGAFSFTGSYVARALLDRGTPVRTLSREADPDHPLADLVDFGRLQFADPEALRRDLAGAATLYNTYWVRFPRGDDTWASVVENTRTLLRAAREAGVERVVHFSVSNPSEESPYQYFRAKALAEREVRESGLSYAIVRPTLMFGTTNLLLDNIAWVLRRAPVFFLPSDGEYATQPVAVEDVAELSIELADGADAVVVDAAGPAVYSFRELVEAVRRSIGARTLLAAVPPRVVVAAARAASLVLRDVLVRREELAVLRDALLVSHEHAPSRRRLEDWLTAEADTLGRSFRRVKG